MPFYAMMCKTKEQAMLIHESTLLDYLSRGLTIKSCYLRKCNIIGYEWEFAILGQEESKP